ncbi:dapper homolog 3-like isoform X2 [Myxocyprinus asiaticus]|uniref:dapper homolog 3-like isoform X2 n=1 Tax=Myxocyprinus asiaticus TaxID=70543 RepID=UPI0022237151|nr:dapper homolog 3-like isoform X2 [Myxocyprinus asiaticus]
MDGERSRNKGRLEASLTWLCELEMLKQRQESLIIGALSLGDTVPGCPAWGDVGPARSSREHEQLTLRRQLNRLQGAPSLLMLTLQQQLSELRVDTGLACEQNTEEDLDSPSASSSDAYMLDWEVHMEPPIHVTLPRSFSAPYPTLEGIAEGIEEEEEEESYQWTTDQMVAVGSMANGNGKLTPKISITTDAEADPTEKIDDGPMAEDIQQAMRTEAYILGLLQHRHLRSTPELDSDPNQWQHLHTHPPSYPNCPDLPLDQPEWQNWAALSEEENEREAQGGYYRNLTNVQIGPTSMSIEEPESSLEIDQYRVAEVPTSNDELDSPLHQRSYLEHNPTKPQYIHTCCNHTCTSMSSTPESCEQHQPLTSQEWTLLRPLVRRGSEERWTSTGHEHTKTTSHSRSENSGLSPGRATQPEHKYFTVGRDMGSHRSKKVYPSSQRLWVSSSDLSQEEEEGISREEACELRHNRLPVHSLKHACVKFKEQDHRFGKGLEAGIAPTDDSNSSLSESFSPGTSSVSSDSDESGGLVWPQQLPPRLPPPSSSQNPSNAVVKIKASHALKKKIMRFRSGSLKLMTTV